MNLLRKLGLMAILEVGVTRNGHGDYFYALSCECGHIHNCLKDPVLCPKCGEENMFKLIIARYIWDGLGSDGAAINPRLEIKNTQV